MGIGATLTKLRKKAGLNQVQLADLCAEIDGEVWPQSRVSHYENERRDPAYSHILTLAQALMVPPKIFFEEKPSLTLVEKHYNTISAPVANNIGYILSMPDEISAALGSYTEGYVIPYSEQSALELVVVRKPGEKRALVRRLFRTDAGTIYLKDPADMGLPFSSLLTLDQVEILGLVQSLR